MNDVVAHMERQLELLRFSSKVVAENTKLRNLLTLADHVISDYQILFGSSVRQLPGFAEWDAAVDKLLAEINATGEEAA